MLAPVYWELMEPQENQFNFKLVDYLLRSARKHQFKLILLWFGSWKNSMSCYVPAWIKTNPARYPRATDRQGRPQEILTPFSPENLQADIKAFSALMRHLQQYDTQHTVIMVQVENEIGMLPEARDHHPLATQAFRAPVPEPLIRYLKDNRSRLSGVVKTSWEQRGQPVSGNWEAVFGTGLSTDEMFIAWHFARYTEAVAEAGKKIYPLPMFVNAALNRPNAKPGEYPSGGPLPHLMDIWKAAAPSIDMLSPDFYNPNFKAWNDLYIRDNNPLFIPEIRFDETVGAKAYYAFGHYRALGFSPFSIESPDEPGVATLQPAYHVLQGVHALLQASSKRRVVDGVLLDKTDITQQQIDLARYRLTFKHEGTLSWSPVAKEPAWPLAGALVIQESDNTFYIAGTGVVVTFETMDAKDGTAGILSVEEGKIQNGQWIPGRRMNGDQDHQGRHVRIDAHTHGVQKVTLYTY